MNDPITRLVWFMIPLAVFGILLGIVFSFIGIGAVHHPVPAPGNLDFQMPDRGPGHLLLPGPHTFFVR